MRVRSPAQRCSWLITVSGSTGVCVKSIGCTLRSMKPTMSSGRTPFVTADSTDARNLRPERRLRVGVDSEIGLEDEAAVPRGGRAGGRVSQQLGRERGWVVPARVRLALVHKADQYQVWQRALLEGREGVDEVSAAELLEAEPQHEGEDRLLRAGAQLLGALDVAEHQAPDLAVRRL
eukprot:557773-Pleurochrysis_carterae.AAC.3